MKTLFLLSRWDEPELRMLLEGFGHSFCSEDLRLETAIEGEPSDQIIMVISPASRDSTELQDRVLRTFEHATNANILRLRLQDVDVPAGFGQLCTTPDWAPATRKAEPVTGSAE